MLAHFRPVGKPAATASSQSGAGDGVDGGGGADLLGPLHPEATRVGGQIGVERRDRVIGQKECRHGPQVLSPALPGYDGYIPFEQGFLSKIAAEP